MLLERSGLSSNAIRALELQALRVPVAQGKWESRGGTGLAAGWLRVGIEPGLSSDAPSLCNGFVH